MNIGSLNGTIKLDSSGFKRGINESTKLTKDFGGSIVKLNQSVELLKTGMRLAMDAGKKAFTQMELGAKRIDVETTFKNLAEGAGRDAEQMIDRLKEATKGAVSEMQAMTAASQAMLSGMQFDDVAVALEYLQKYAKATDKSFQQLVSTIMTGMARGSVLMLDDAGIILDQTSLLAEAQIRYGRSLSEVEKKQVLVNAAIDQMKAKMPLLGGEIATQYDQLQSWKAEWQDLNSVMGKWALRGYGFARMSVKGFQLAFTDTKILLTQMKAGFVTHFGDMVLIVQKAMMAIVTTIRNNLSHTLAAIWDVDNFVVNPLKEGLDSAVKGLDAALVKLFDAGMGITFAEHDTNERLKELYEERKQIIGESAKWYDLALGNFAADGQIPKLDLGSIFDTGSTAAVEQVEDALKTLQQHIDDLKFDKATIGLDRFQYEMQEADYWAEQLREQFKNLIPENPQIDKLIEKIRRLKQELATLRQNYDDSQLALKEFEGTFKESTDAMAQPLADAFEELSKTGKLSVGELAKSLLESLRVFAAQKLAHFLMEGIYHTLMSFVNTSDPSHKKKAAIAYKGAGIMSGFVAGSALSGMAHSGIAKVPEDGTWLLQKGERVVDSKTNEDLRGFLQNAGKGVGTVNQTVHIHGGDEEGVKRALPELRRTIVEVINQDIASNGPTRRTIKAYAR